MFKAIAILASLVSVAAFTPARPSSGRAASLKMGFEDTPGVLPPEGFFDPLGPPKHIDQEKFDHCRTPSISAALERYITESSEILRIRDAQELEANSLRLAFVLQAKDKELSILEKDKEILRTALEKEKDKELSVLQTALEKDKEILRTVLEKEKEKELALVKRTFLERDAYRKSLLMHVTQRYVKSVFERMQTSVTGTIRSLLEKLFKDFIVCYQRPIS